MKDEVTTRTFIPGAGGDLALDKDVEINAQGEFSVVLVSLEERVLWPTQVPQHRRHVTEK